MGREQLNGPGSLHTVLEHQWGGSKLSGRTKGELKLPPKSWCAEELRLCERWEVVTREGIEIEGGWNIPLPKRAGQRIGRWRFPRDIVLGWSKAGREEGGRWGLRE